MNALVIIVVYKIYNTKNNINYILNNKLTEDFLNLDTYLIKNNI